MEGQCLTQPDLDSSSTGLRGAEKRLNSRVRAKACEGSQSHALGDDSAAAAGHTRQTKARTHGGSPSGDRLPAAGDVGEDARVRRTSKREGAPGGAASASPGGASSRELRRGTSSPAASRSSAAPGPTPAPKPSAHSAEASAPLSAASQHAQSASLAATERLLRAGLAALGGSSLPGGGFETPSHCRAYPSQPPTKPPPIQPPLTVDLSDHSGLAPLRPLDLSAAGAGVVERGGEVVRGQGDDARSGHPVSHICV